MSLPWIEKATILLVKTGSHAYGMAAESSDVDLRGVCVPPKEVRDNIFQNFTQEGSSEFVLNNFSYLRNPQNPKLDSEIYDFRKFCRLASECNPNILEMLFIPFEDHLIKTSKGKLLYDNRHLFLSRRAAYTFSGYAVAQLKKIERHRKWILNPPNRPPSREEMGLPEQTRLTQTIDSIVKKRIEDWNLSRFGLDDESRKEIKEEIFILIRELTGQSIDWDNWPLAFKFAALKELSNKLDLSDELLSILIKESQWKDLNDKWNNYLHWKENRNKGRQELEKSFGYDSKHAAHLVRLLRSGLELIQNGELIVNRPDAKELLSIRNGGWSYEKIINYSEEMEQRILVAKNTSPLPKDPDRDKINKLILELSKDCS